MRKTKIVASKQCACTGRNLKPVSLAVLMNESLPANGIGSQPPLSPGASDCGGRKVLPPVCLLGALGSMLYLHFMAPITNLPLGQWRFIGLVPLGTGLALNLLADAALRGAKTAVQPGVRPQALVTSGAYRLSRNPMYLGFVLILLGAAILLGTTTPFIVVLAFAIFLRLKFIREEEQALGAAFGAQWLEYRRRVRRWI